MNHLPALRVVQYHFIIGYLCQDLAFCRLQLCSWFMFWRVAVQRWPHVWRCWRQSLSLPILSLCSLVRTLRLILVCHVIAFHPSNFELLTSCSGVLSLLLSFLCSPRSCFLTGCAKFNCASERVTFKPGGRRTRFLSTPCLALCV